MSYCMVCYKNGDKIKDICYGCQKYFRLIMTIDIPSKEDREKIESGELESVEAQ